MFSSGWEGCPSPATARCSPFSACFSWLGVMCARAHTHRHAHADLYITPKDALTHTLTHMCTNICTHAHSCIHSLTHMLTYTHVHKHLHACTQLHSYSLTPMLTHTHVHIHLHTCTQLHSYSLTLIHIFAHSQRRCTIVSGTLIQVHTGFIFSTHRSNKFALVLGNPTLSRVKAKGKTQTCVSDLNSLSTLGCYLHNCVVDFYNSPKGKNHKRRQITTQQGKAGLTSHPLERKAEYTSLKSHSRGLPLPGTHISRMDDVSGAPFFPMLMPVLGTSRASCAQEELAQKQSGFQTLYGKHRLQTSLHLRPTASAAHCSPAPQTSPSPQTPMWLCQLEMMPTSDHRLVARQSLRLEGQYHPHSSFLKGHVGLPVLKLETLSSLSPLSLNGVFSINHTPYTIKAI